MNGANGFHKANGTDASAGVGTTSNAQADSSTDGNEPIDVEQDAENANAANNNTVNDGNADNRAQGFLHEGQLIAAQFTGEAESGEQRVELSIGGRNSQRVNAWFSEATNFFGPLGKSVFGQPIAESANECGTVSAHRPRKTAVTAPRLPTAPNGNQISNDPNPPPSLRVLRSNVPKRTVIVIGAGISGLICALLLHKRGFNVIVLEGRDRVGGRLRTDWSLGSAVDMGAAFIHGTFGNPLSKIVDSQKLRTYEPADSLVLRRPDGTIVNQQDDENALNSLESMLKRIGSFAKKSTDIPDESLQFFLDAYSQHLDVDKTGDFPSVLEWNLANLEQPCAAKTSELSARNWDMDTEHALLGAHVLIRDGFSAIAQSLAMQFGKNVIRLGSTVKEIHYDVPLHVHPSSSGNTGTEAANGNGNGSSPSTSAILRRTSPKPNGQCRTSDGASVSRGGGGESVAFEETKRSKGVRVLTRDGKEYLAETCVVTLPLGVLKSGTVKFEPKLPGSKTTAIKKIGFGLLNKVALRFEHAFWYQNEGDSEEREPDYICRVAETRGDYYMFLSLTQCTGAPILVAMCAGECAEEIEKMADSYIVEKAVKAITDMYPEESKDVKLLSYKVTRWRADEFARGSYSFAKVHSTPADFEELAKPVGDTLRFAGEATIVEHMATAHGAFMTGCREAAEILKLSDLSPAVIEKGVQEIRATQTPYDGEPAGDSIESKRASNSRKRLSINRRRGAAAAAANSQSANNRPSRKRQAPESAPGARRSTRRKT